MAANTLFDGPLPVCIHAPSIIPPQNSPRTPLNATLTYTPADSTLSLTISDLTTRLLLLHHVQTADTFPSARSPKSLSVDFSAYPDLVARHLHRAVSDLSFVAFLQLPTTPTTSTEQLHHPILRVIEFEHGYNTTRIELLLVHASQSQLISELADRARHAETLTSELSRIRTQVETLRTERDVLAHRAETGESRLEAAAETSQSLVAARQEANGQRTLAEQARSHAAEIEATRARLAATLEARESDITQLRNDAEESSVWRGNAERRIVEMEGREKVALQSRDEAAAEIRRGNEIITALQTRVRALLAEAKAGTATAKEQRARGKVKAALVAKLEERVGGLERELIRARDRAALLEVEKEGLNGRLESALRKLEDNRAVLETDQQVIAYLNRELNDRLMSEVSPTGSGRGRGRSPQGGTVGEPVGTGVA